MNNYAFRIIGSDIMYGPYTAEDVLRLRKAGKHPDSTCELYELVSAKVIPAQEARVVRA